MARFRKESGFFFNRSFYVESGRLSQRTLELLHDCGISFDNGGSNKLVSVSSNFPLRLLFMRDDDIPECIADDIADAGILGENMVAEQEHAIAIAERLGFGRCRLALAVPKAFSYNSLADLNGRKIATSYPRILQRHLDQNGVQATIHEISGSVEIAPGIGLADAIFDIVSTGSTLLANGLREVETVMKSEAVLVSRENLPQEKQAILDKLLFRLRSVKKAKDYKYILLNAPDDSLDTICGILPGMKSPTIMALAESGWSSVHSVIREADFWERIEDLRQAGAQGILVIPIEKMIS